MRILHISGNDANYLAKCHEAFKTGLRRCFDTRMFGKGYDGFDPNIESLQEIIDLTFPDAPPDLVIVPNAAEHNSRYAGLEDVRVPKTVLVADYWNYVGEKRDQFLEMISAAGMTFVMSYFPQPLELFKDHYYGSRFVYTPPCFDPQIFNDWQRRKSFDVGFLAAGTTDFISYYPERFAIHQRLLKRTDIRYLWANHPGWDRYDGDRPLVGKNFSKSIGSCRLFITTGGIFKNAHAKYIEILASGATLLADRPVGAEQLGLKDGENYVEISEADVEDKIDYLLSHQAEAERIAEAGYQLVMRHHNCYARAVDFYDQTRGFRSNGSSRASTGSIGSSNRTPVPVNCSSHAENQRRDHEKTSGAEGKNRAR